MQVSLEKHIRPRSIESLAQMLALRRTIGQDKKWCPYLKYHVKWGTSVARNGAWYSVGADRCVDRDQVVVEYFLGH